MSDRVEQLAAQLRGEIADGDPGKIGDLLVALSAFPKMNPAVRMEIIRMCGERLVLKAATMRLELGARG